MKAWLAKLKEDRQQLTMHYQQERGKATQAQSQLELKQNENAGMKKEQETLLLKKEILEQASVTAREQGKQLFETVVTNSIQMVFEEESKALIQLGKRANVATAELLILSERGGLMVETDPAEEDGGGLGDMVDLAAFTSKALLAGNQNTAPFFWDEPTKFVSAANAEATANFIQEICRYSGRQTFLTTHERTYLPYVADRSFLVKLDLGTGSSDVTLLYEKEAEMEEAPSS